MNTVLFNKNKIAIIGISASGKTMVAELIAKKTGLPLFHIDQLMYTGNWNLCPEEEYNLLHKKLLASHSRWIIEGYVYEKMLNRLEEADLIIYLDYSGMRNVWQYIKRYITHRKKNRTELPDAKEVFYWRIFKRLFDKGKEWRVIEDVLRKVGDKEKVLRISSPRELCAYLKYC